MSLPEWGRSYTALFVPVTSDWQCSLVPAHDVEEPGAWWRLSYEERQQKRREKEKQIEQDRRDFLQLFRVRLSRREALFSPDFPAYVDFIRNTLRASIWSTPIDGDGVVRVLCDAVSGGRLVPAIDRAWRGSRRVTRSYAPQSWPQRAPDPKPLVYRVLNGQFIPLNADGSFVDYTPYVPGKDTVAAAASSTANSGGGFDWLDVAETAVGAVLGGDSALDDGSGLDDDFTAGAGDDSTPLGDAQAFEFAPDVSSGDIEELAVNDRGSAYACDIISAECKGSVLREFPGQYLNSTLDDIQNDAQDGIKDARKALKLLNDGRFKK